MITQLIQKMEESDQDVLKISMCTPQFRIVLQERVNTAYIAMRALKTDMDDDQLAKQYRIHRVELDFWSELLSFVTANMLIVDPINAATQMENVNG